MLLAVEDKVRVFIDERDDIRDIMKSLGDGAEWQGSCGDNYMECKRRKYDPSNAKNSGLQQHRRAVAYHSYPTLLIVVREFLVVSSYSKDSFL